MFADPDDALEVEGCIIVIWQVTSIAKRGSGTPSNPQGRKLEVPVLEAKLILVIQLREGRVWSPQRAWSNGAVATKRILGRVLAVAWLCWMARTTGDDTYGAERGSMGQSSRKTRPP